MNPYDVSPDDEPLDVAAVGTDDALIESLRRSLSPEAAVVWDDDEDDLDPAFALLRVLQRDVAADLPAAAGLLPAGVTALAPRQRRFGRTATIAAVTAGVLSVGGVAAASGGIGSPLAGVRSAVTSVVNAITPDHPVGPAVTKPRDSASPKASPAVSAAARSAAATAQIAAQLDKAARLLDAGKLSAAQGQLDSAARRLPLVLNGTTRDGFAARITALRVRLASPRPAAGHHNDSTGSAGQGQGTNGSGQSGRPTTSDNATSDNATSGQSRSATSGKSGDSATPASEQGGRAEPSRAPRVEKSAPPKSDVTDHAPAAVDPVDESGKTGTSD